MSRHATYERLTKETRINAELDLDGQGSGQIDSGIPFFDHMLNLFATHGFMDLELKVSGDLEVDFHHTVEDTGLVLGELLNRALGDRKGICRFGHVATPMDESLAMVTVDLSKRPFFVYHGPVTASVESGFNLSLAKEFLRAFATRGGLNLHVNVPYGENGHHIIESVFKSLGRALDQAVTYDNRINDVRSTKGVL